MTIHVHPVADLIEHELISDACVCGPRCELAGEMLVVHSALDGREHREPGHDRQECPLCRS